MLTIIGLLIPLLIIVISSYIIWKGTDLFDGAASYLGRNLSHGVKGATINAIGSSMPEFLSTLIFLFYLDSSEGLSGGIGITAGSAIFNLLVIPIAIMGTLKFRRMDSHIKISRRVILRDGGALLAINILLILILRSQAIYWYHGLILSCSYLLYFLFIWNQMKKVKDKPEAKNDREYEIKALGSLKQSLCDLDLVTLVFPSRYTNKKLSMVYIIYTVLIVSIGTWLLVYSIEQISAREYMFWGYKLHGIGFPTVFVSLILGAAASSVPDTLLSIKDALKGNYKDAISNCIGSNIFDISFALGLPILIYTLIKGHPIELTPLLKSLNVNLWIILFIVNVITIGGILIRGRIDREVGVMMTIIYLAFITYVVVISLGGEIPCFVV
ncbi:hypothetical protein OAT16_08535 [Prolixibacteraceae bacterium]|nr:hypothetical protein [Prolixibacteraceae bacterium]